MNDVGKKLSIAELIKDRIRIPMIQRDYAQGRANASDTRERFLDALERALNPKGDCAVPLNLDFIYGSLEGDSQKFFSPLDGQQRLTTLFLLHWYLAWADGQWESFASLFKDGNKSRFSYDVRPSSQDFFNYLVGYIPARPPCEVEEISALITNQSWYLLYFDRDPTIQSALAMLNAIHARLRAASGLYARLTDSQAPAITFQALNLKDFGLSDDLYIKMNARGKGLTPFETFKAMYEDKLEAIFQSETRPIGGTSLKIKEFVSLRLDTTWSNFFWNYSDPSTHVYDDAIMNLFRLVVLITRDPGSKEFVSDANSLSNIVTPPTYTAFEKRQWLDREFTEMLIALMERWSIEEKRIKPLLPSAVYFEEVRMFDRTVLRSSKLYVWEIVQLAGYALFISHYDQGTLDPDHFQEWMRIVRNLTVNSTLDRTEDLPNAMRGLAELLPHRETILKHLSSLLVKSRIIGFGLHAVREEILKAGLILNHPGWRELIDTAEAHPYFKGQIGFLCDFCGASVEWDGSSRFDWPSARHEEFQRSFRDYLQKAEMMFNSTGLIDLGDYRWERALLCMGDYLLPTGTSENYSFLVNPPTDPVSWKRLLRGGDDIESKRRFVKDLWDNLNITDPVAPQLDAIITARTALDPWIEALVSAPQAIAFCRLRSIRWISDFEIYLLSKVRMSSSHAELYTYALYHNVLRGLQVSGKLKPLSLYSYGDVAGKEHAPFIWFQLLREAESFWFFVEFTNGGYRININQAPAEKWPELTQLLLQSRKFTNTGNRLVTACARNDIENTLLDLVHLLRNLDTTASQ